MTYFPSRQVAMGAWHSSGCPWQPPELGQHRFPPEFGKDHPRHLLDSPQPVHGHATRWAICWLYKNRFNSGYLVTSWHPQNSNIWFMKYWVKSIFYQRSGDHKKRAKYRFASKTLMRILPGDLKNEVEGLIAKNTMTLDLYEILGQCTWGQRSL